MEIEDLYTLISDFLCTPGCHECCENFGVPSRTQADAEAEKIFMRGQGGSVPNPDYMKKG